MEYVQKHPKKPWVWGVISENTFPKENEEVLLKKYKLLADKKTIMVINKKLSER
jgi:hypothetical protein